MSNYRDKKEWNKWNEMVLASEHSIEDFHDFADDIAIVRADKKIQSLRSKNLVQQTQLAEKDAEIQRLKGMLSDVNNIVYDSEGVAGYHNNGDVALWDEFEEITQIYDELDSSKLTEKDAEIERLNNNNEAYVEFCNSLFFDIPHGDPRLIKLKEKLTEAKP